MRLLWGMRACALALMLCSCQFAAVAQTAYKYSARRHRRGYGWRPIRLHRQLERHRIRWVLAQQRHHLLDA